MRLVHHDTGRELDQEWDFCNKCGQTYTAYEMDFANSSVEPTVGETLTGVTSGKTATVSTVTKVSGTYAAGTATGTIVVTSPSGDFTDGETINGSTGGAAMLVCRVYVPREYGRAYPVSALVEYQGTLYYRPHFRAFAHTIEDAQTINLQTGDEI